MIVGKKYTASNTLAIKGNGLIPGEEGYVSFVDEVAISVEFPKRGVELKVPRYLFGNNFERSTLDRQENTAYQKSAHATSVFKWPINK